MKLSIRCLSQFRFIAKIPSSPPTTTINTRLQSINTGSPHCRQLWRSLTRIIGRDVVHVPHGHIPVYVSEKMKRFIISAELLTAPVIMKLLNISAQKYGYHQQGVLRISCDVIEFERILEAVRRNMAFDSEDFDENYSLEEESYYEGPQ